MICAQRCFNDLHSQNSLEVLERIYCIIIIYYRTYCSYALVVSMGSSACDVCSLRESVCVQRQLSFTHAEDDALRGAYTAQTANQEVFHCLYHSWSWFHQVHNVPGSTSLFFNIPGNQSELRDYFTGDVSFSLTTRDRCFYTLVIQLSSEFRDK